MNELNVLNVQSTKYKVKKKYTGVSDIDQRRLADFCTLAYIQNSHMFPFKPSLETAIQTTESSMMTAMKKSGYY